MTKTYSSCMISRENSPDVQSSTMTALYSLANWTSLPVHVAFIPCIASFFQASISRTIWLTSALWMLENEDYHYQCSQSCLLSWDGATGRLVYLPGKIFLSLHVWLQTVYKEGLLLSDSIAFLLGDLPTIFHAAVTSYGVQQELRILACKQALYSLLYQNARSC